MRPPACRGFMVYTVRNAQEAVAALEHFNYFHDGFIKRVELLSHDRFEQNGPAYTDRAHVCTGNFEVNMDIAHYNYEQGNQPCNRLIKCRFEVVQSFLLDLRTHQHGNQAREELPLCLEQLLLRCVQDCL